MGAYKAFYARSIEEREAFWADEAKAIHWHRPFERVLDYSRPPFARAAMTTSTTFRLLSASK